MERLKETVNEVVQIVRPGDVVVLKFSYEFDDGEREHVRNLWKERLGERAKDYPLIVLDNSMELTVLRSEKAVAQS